MLRLDQDTYLLGDHVVVVVRENRYESRLAGRSGRGGWAPLPFCMVEAFG